MGEKGAIQSVIKQWAPFSGKLIKSEAIVNRDEVKKSIEDHLTVKTREPVRSSLKDQSYLLR